MDWLAKLTRISPCFAMWKGNLIGIRRVLRNGEPTMPRARGTRQKRSGDVEPALALIGNNYVCYAKCDGKLPLVSLGTDKFTNVALPIEWLQSVSSKKERGTPLSLSLSLFLLPPTPYPPFANFPFLANHLSVPIIHSIHPNGMARRESKEPISSQYLNHEVIKW